MLLAPAGQCQEFLTVPKRIRLLVLPVILLLPIASWAADGPAKPAEATAADVATLKQLFRAASSWDDRGRHTLHDGMHKHLAALADQVGNAKLRDRTRQLLPELERATILHARVRRVLADLKAVQGIAQTEPSGPPWLRDLVGGESMQVFTKLTGIDVCDRSIPIKSGIKNERITDAWLERMADLPDVRALDISVTVVKGPGLTVVGTLKNLESLNLTLTLVTDPHLVHLRGLTKLRALYLASTKCTGEGLKDLGGLNQLDNLNCHSAPVNDAGLEQIGRLTSLQRLEIVHTHFTDAGAQHLSRLTNMRRIQLGSREATGAAVAPLRAMTKLRELDLHDGLVTTEGVKYASAIPSLTVLRLYAGPVKDEGFRHIGKLTNLETLIAQGVQLTDAGLEHLTGLKKLKRLEIQGNAVSDAAVARLKKALPGVEIVR
jgi:hypothetical protein